MVRAAKQIARAAKQTVRAAGAARATGICLKDMARYFLLLFIWPNPITRGGKVEKGKLHQPSEPFLASVDSIREAEARSDQIVKRAEEGASKLNAAAREKAVEIGVKASDGAIAEKNAMIAKGRSQAAKMAGQLLASAKAQAEKISGAKISPREAAEIASKIKL